MITEIRCSQLHRPMECIGFLFMENLEEPEAGQPAKDGTATGELLTAMIKQQTDKPVFGAYASNGTFLDNDMRFYARDTYNAILESARGCPIESEERIDWKTRSGITIRGQFDISYTVHRRLHVEDLKYGWKIVEVEKNWQLIGYGIGQYFRLQQKYGYTPDEFVFKIHQPRPYHPKGRVREWIISTQELFELYYQQIDEMTMKYMQGVRDLKTGEHCRYCPAAASGCPAFNKAFYNAVDVVMNEWQQDILSNAEISKQLALIEKVQDIMKIKADSLEQLAIMRLQNNQAIPGYAFETELGDRKWKDGTTAETIKILTGFDATKLDMLSPNQAEKAGLNRKFVAQLTERASKGRSLVKKDIVEEAKLILPKPYGGT